MTLAWKARRLCQASSQGPPQLPRPRCGPPASAPLRVHLLLPRGGSRERGSGPPQLLRFWSPAGSGGLASPRSLPQTCWSELACSACQKHFLSRSLTSWSVEELTSKACVPRSGTSGAQSRAPGLWWTLTQRQPVPLLVRCWAVSSALPSARLIFVLLLIHKESFSGCHTLLVLCDTFLGGRHRAGFHCSQRFPCLPGRFHELLPR